MAGQPRFDIIALRICRDNNQGVDYRPQFSPYPLGRMCL